MSWTDELTDALKNLPRHAAPPGFTEAVLHRLDEAPARHTPAWPALAGTAAVAACLALAVGLGLGLGLGLGPRGGDKVDRVDEVDWVDSSELAPKPSTQSTLSTPPNRATHPTPAPAPGPAARAAAVARLEQQQRQLRQQHSQLQAELEALRQLALEDSRAVYLGGDERVDLVWGLDPPTGYDPASYHPRR